VDEYYVVYLELPMNIVQAVILSIIEGISEFLPISSTGHMILAANFMHIAQTEFVKSFEIIIQFGAILAVVALYWKKLVKQTILWKPLIAAFLPAAVIGLLLYKVIKGYLIGNPFITVLSLFIGGIILLFIEKLLKRNEHTPVSELSIKQAVIIGIFQSVSIIPGVSRAAATIVGGLGVGLTKHDAVEFSFLLAIPTMAAATGLDLIKSSLHFTQGEYMLLAVGFIGAFFTALIAVKTFLAFVQKHTFIPFGIYRIVIAILFFLFVKG
jgi:undecaprenyl-diphosphatase